MRSPGRSMRVVVVAGIAFTWAGLVACSRGVDEPLQERSSALLVVNQANVFGFEDPTQWRSSVALSSSTTHTEGGQSLGVRAKGYTEVTSAALSSLTGVTGTLAVDVLLPTQQPNPFWYGSVQLLVSVPSKGINNQFIGQVDVTGRPLNQFFELDFNLPQSLVNTLQAGGYSDFRVKLVANVPFNATGTYLFDRLRFSAGANGAVDLVETNILARWTSGSTDGATTQLSVLSGSQAFFGQSGLRAVTNAALDFWLRYDAPAPVDVGTNGFLRAASRALNLSPNGWQIAAPIIVVEDTTGARMTLSPDANSLPVDGTTWVDIRAPRAGGSGWTRTGANVDLHRVRALELHADTWDSGFTWDVDAVMFTGLFDACSGTPAPFTAAASARATTATVTYSAVAGAVGYNIYRSPAGQPPAFLTRARGTTFEDSGLALGMAYQYEVRPFMASGCESGFAATTVATRTSAVGLTRIPTLKVLVPIYIGTTDPYTTTEIARMKAGIELGRQFYFRNSRGRLNLTLDYFEINAAAPSTDGPTMSNVEPDLRARGIADNQYQGVFAVARDLGGCWGGFLLLGETVGAFATACGVPYPSNDPNVNTDMTWNFTHEFQHAFDLLADLVGADLISGHPDSVYQDLPYTGPIIDAGEHFDWERATLRMFTGYDTLASPFNGYLEVEDPDGDGLASNDARLPIDEQRFGSRPDLPDTDGDGLDDRGEYAAGIYGSSNPLAVDTDGDGQRDNVDPTPRAAIAAGVTAATPTIDGVRDTGYTLFRNGVEFTNVAGFTAATYLAYDANYLYILAEESQSASLNVIVDGSGANGFWQGDDSYAFSLTPGQPQPLNHTSRHGTQEPGVAPAGSLLATRTVGATTIIEARVPRANLGQGFGWTGSTTNGFPTSQGSVLGLRVWFTQFGGAGDLFGPPWATQNEYFHFDDVALR